MFSESERKALAFEAFAAFHAPIISRETCQEIWDSTLEDKKNGTQEGWLKAVNAVLACIAMYGG